MAGVRISELTGATAVSTSDILYLANGGNPRKFSLAQLITFLLENHFVITINDKDGASGSITLTKADVGLGNVSNALGVTTLNGVEGAATITGSAGVVITGNNTSKSINVNVGGIQLPFGQITGDPLSNAALAAALASVGVQLGIRTINLGTGSLDLAIQDIQRPWVDVDFTTPTSVRIPNAVDAPVGAVIEVRQEGTGVITIVGDSVQIVNQRPGVRYTTEGRGTRIQVVSLGTKAWEYR